MTRQTVSSSLSSDAVITINPPGSEFVAIDDIALSYSGIPLTSGVFTVKSGSTIIFNLNVNSGDVILYPKQLVALNGGDTVELRLTGISSLIGKINVNYSY